MTLSRFFISLLAIITLYFGGLSAQTPAVGHSLRVNGFEMYYEIHGNGEPLVLLHGITQAGATWAPIVPDVKEEYRVIVPDLRGHGRSTNPSKEFTHRQAALDVYALLDELGVRKFKAMGISSGGMTLIHMATSQPERVESMVLIGASNYFTEETREYARKHAPENMTEERWALMRKRHSHGDEQIMMLQSQFHGFKDSYDDMNFTKPFLSTITARTLIVHGDRDILFPVKIPTEIYKAIPHSYLWIIPNGGHIPIFGDSLESFIKTTGQFLHGAWEQE